jgi:tetratricopeptide (TPR) repeat protein
MVNKENKMRKKVLCCILGLLLPWIAVAQPVKDIPKTSKALTASAWASLDAKQYDEAMLYANLCIQQFEDEAVRQQEKLTKEPGIDITALASLNDVATCYFIKGMIWKGQNEVKTAADIFQHVAETYPGAQCWDPRGWYWKVAESARDKILEIQKQIDFGDYSSEFLSKQAEASYKAGDYDKTLIYADKCIASFSELAKKQQESLIDFPQGDARKSYWALNGVARSLFFRGKALNRLGKKEEAQKQFQIIIDSYSYAQSENGTWWRVAEAAKHQIFGILNNVDFEDVSSAGLTGKAWESLRDSKLDKVLIYADKCIELYQAEADKMQSPLKKCPPQEEAVKLWALNDVATAYFIKAKAYLQQGQTEKAVEIFDIIKNRYHCAQAYDPRGWWWRVSEAAEDQIRSIRLGISFDDYTSQTLTKKAWEALNAKQPEAAIIYARKCIRLYGTLASEMQTSLKQYPPQDEIQNYWALNDVGVCHYIMGTIYVEQKNFPEALDVFRALIDKFYYAQGWDSSGKGFFWKPAVKARGIVHKIAEEYGVVY